MYAIVEVGGKQYKVEPNTYFKTEKIDANVGDKVELPCLLVYKYKAKKNVRKKQGHRQPYTKLKVVSIG